MIPSSCNCNPLPDPARRAFFTHTAMAAAAGVAAAAGPSAGPPPQPRRRPPGKRKFMEEATRLAMELVQKGWGGPFGAVIVKDGEIIGRGQNRVPLTGCPVFHAEVTAIIDASGKLNPKGSWHRLRRRHDPGNDPARGKLARSGAERARMLKGCDIYINGAPCPMCMSAIYWSRIDRVFFGNSLKDTSKIGFDDAFQYEDFAKPWSERHIPIDGKLRARHHVEVLQGLDG